MKVKIETLRAHHDARGSLFEPLDDTELLKQKNVHVVVSEPGAVRGNHVHFTATEMTSLMGPCQIRLKEDGQLRDLTVPSGEVWRLTIPPGVVHAFRNTGDKTMLLVSFSSEPHDPTGASMRREEIL